jgi:hypothetical protein
MNFINTRRWQNWFSISGSETPVVGNFFHSVANEKYTDILTFIKKINAFQVVV